MTVYYYYKCRSLKFNYRNYQFLDLIDAFCAYGVPCNESFILIFPLFYGINDLLYNGCTTWLTSTPTWTLELWLGRMITLRSDWVKAYLHIAALCSIGIATSLVVQYSDLMWLLMKGMGRNVARYSVIQPNFNKHPLQLLNPAYNAQRSPIVRACSCAAPEKNATS